MKTTLLLLMAVLPVNSQDSRIIFGGVATGRADTKNYGDIYIIDPDGDTTPVLVIVRSAPAGVHGGREAVQAYQQQMQEAVSRPEPARRCIPCRPPDPSHPVQGIQAARPQSPNL